MKPEQHIILIVDDEPDLRELLVEECQYYGFKTIEATNGHEGFEATRQPGIDLVLSDIRMPGCDGIEMLGKVKKNRPELPVILMSGYLDQGSDDLLEKGASALLAKPIDFDQLQSLIKKLISEKGSRLRAKGTGEH